MKTLHILTAGTVGGIEQLCKDFFLKTPGNNQHICFIKGIGQVYEELKNYDNTFSIFGDESYKLSNVDKVSKKIAKYVNINKIDRIIFHHNNMFNYLVCLKLIKMKYKVFLYVHAAFEDTMFESKKIKSHIKKFLFKKIIKKCTAVILISEFVKKSITKCIKIDEKKFHVIYNGVSTNEFSYDIYKKNNPIKLVYVGRLTENKGVQNALKLLSNTNVNYTFDIIGQGSYMEELKKLTNDLGLNEKVNFLGVRRDVKQILKNYDAFVHIPKWEEGFGITVIEAMAAGLVCIVSNKGAMPEIINNGINGFIIKDECDQEGFNSSLSMIYNGLESNFYENVIKRAKEFDIYNTIKSLENI